MIEGGSGCFSLRLVAVPSLRDVILFKEDDRGGSEESGVFSIVTFVLFDLLSGSEAKFTLDDAADG